MSRRPFFDVAAKGIARDDIGKKDIGDRKRDRKEDGLLCSETPEAIEVPGTAMAGMLRSRRTIDPPFDLSKDHLHKDRLRTEPPAPDPSQHRCKQNDGNKARKKEHDDQVKILRPERIAKEDELPVQNIEQEKLLAADRYERSEREERQQEDREGGPPSVKRSTRLFRIDPFTPPIRRDAGKLRPKSIVGDASLLILNHIEIE